MGLIVDWAAGKIMKGGGHGTLTDIVIGTAGASVGGWIMLLLGFSSAGGLIYAILVAIGGAVVLAALVRMVRKPRA